MKCPMCGASLAETSPGNKVCQACGFTRRKIDMRILCSRCGAPTPEEHMVPCGMCEGCYNDAIAEDERNH